MDRTIKFRFWRDNKMQMAHTMNAYDNNNFAGDGEILMQFTGLLDCEGKEIFEGDILEYKEYHAHIKWWSSVEEIPIIAKKTEQQRQDFRIERREVRFDQGAFCLGYTPLEKFCRNNVLVEKLEFGKHFTGDYEKKQWDFKVIGNLYEHPNLLTNEV